MNRWTGPLAALMAGLVLSGSVYAKQAFKDFDFDALNTNPDAVTSKFVDVKALSGGTFSRMPSLTGVKRVVVAGFEVVFQETVQQAVQGGGLVGGLTKGNYQSAKWVVNINGLSPELAQSLTDGAYQQFKDRLTAAGLEVLPAETLAQSPAFQKLLEESRAKSMADTGLPTQYLAKVSGNVQRYVTPAELPMLVQESTMGFAAFGNNARIRQLGHVMTELGPVSVVTALFHLDTEKLTTIGNAGWVRTTDADRTFGVMMNPGSYLTLYPAVDGKPAQAYQAMQIALKKPIAMTEPVGDAIMTGENIGAQVLSGALRVAGLPAPNVRRLRKYEVTLDPTRYPQQTAQVFDATTRLMTTSLQTRLAGQ